jgi:hypothetical protein
MTRALVLIFAMLALPRGVAATPIALPSQQVDAGGYFYEVFPGDYVLLDASDSFSNTPDFTGHIPIVMYEWDLNNDGTFEGDLTSQFVVHTLAGIVPSDLRTSSPFVYWQNANWAFGLDQSINLRVLDASGQRSLASEATIRVLSLDSRPPGFVGPQPPVTVPEHAAGVELIAGAVGLAGYLFRSPQFRRRRKGQ